MAFTLDNTYPDLGENFYSYVTPKSLKDPEILLLNKQLLKWLDIAHSHDLVDYLSGQKLLAKPYAMAYAGHQFGHFTMLGDGRAAVLGEHLTQSGRRYDLQLKGSGVTPYSRGGDGRATAASMLREYLFCSALHGLGVKSSQALAVVLTGKKVFRDYDAKSGAILVRVMQSHVRIGTFEYAAAYLDRTHLQRLADYVINRHYPKVLDTSGNRYISFFEAVTDRLIDMVVDWLRVGFVHGVMNTDNMSITGETFDYGPCAFINRYDPGAVFSSIDRGGRYSFGNQKEVLHWNLARFAQALLPLIHPDSKKAAQTMNAILATFEKRFDKKFYAMMRKKVGLAPDASGNDGLIDRLLGWMERKGADYTNTFLALADNLALQDPVYEDRDFVDIKSQLLQAGADKALMARANPCVIPRNYLVEEVIEAYEQTGSLQKLQALLDVLQEPYSCKKYNQQYQKPPSPEFDTQYATFCNT